jgi:hypothetical protein
MPGLKSSLVGLDTVLGRDEDIDFADYLNRTTVLHLSHCVEPENREKSVDVLAAMEKRLYGKTATAQSRFSS